ncbi:hypothetical protein HGM15179_021031, partial [Zosterops borbonicus]
DAGGAPRLGRAFRHQDPEEGRGGSGRRRRLHPGGEEGPGPGAPPAFPHTPALHIPDPRPAVLCDGVRHRGGSHVPHPAGREIQGAARG